MKQKLSELTSQPPLLDLGTFIIRPFQDDLLWMENDIGEGMTILKDDLATALNKFFDEVF